MLLGFYVSLVLHVQPVRWECGRVVEMLYDWGKLRLFWLVDSRAARYAGNKMLRDSIMGAHSSLIFEEIIFRPCIWNVGGEADSSVFRASWQQVSLNEAFALTEVKLFNVFNSWPVFEYGSLIIRFAMVATEINVFAYCGSAVWLCLERVRFKWMWHLRLEIMFHVV